MRRIGSLVIISLALCGTARADLAGEKVMKRMDASFTKAKDQYFEYDIITTQPGKAETKMTMKTWIKGENWRLVEYTSPGDVKGMKALVLSLDELYIYLPAFKKVRRVAAHAREASFMGTALSQDDTSIVTYNPIYEPKLVGEDKDTWKLQSFLRKGKHHPYPRIDWVVLKKYDQPSKVLYYNAKGGIWKTEERLEYSCQGDICNARRMLMTDHSRGGLRTELVRTAWKVNTGVSDSMFTPRSLQRGN